MSLHKEDPSVDLPGDENAQGERKAEEGAQGAYGCTTPVGGCGVVCPGFSKFICTRGKRHPGEHIAATGMDGEDPHIACVWPWSPTESDEFETVKERWEKDQAFVRQRYPQAVCLNTITPQGIMHRVWLNRANLGGGWLTQAGEPWMAWFFAAIEVHTIMEREND